MERDFLNYLEEKKRLVDDTLRKFMEEDESEPKILWDAMKYTLFAGGKRFRPAIAILGYEIAGGDDLGSFLPAACSIELIHTFSLIHDDLPALDNDDFRRGKPTSHRVFGEAIAILAGDALFSYAFSVLLKSKLDDTTLLQILREILDATGPEGMIGGQVFDILAEGKEPTPQMVVKIHERKTSALIRASLTIGGIAAKAPVQFVDFYRRIGRKMGLTFQIVDDILDVEGKKDKLGKSVGKDEKQKKCTYPRVFGLKRSKEEAKRLVYEIEEEVREFLGDRGKLLVEASKFIVSRVY